MEGICPKSSLSPPAPTSLSSNSPGAKLDPSAWGDPLLLKGPCCAHTKQ